MAIYYAEITYETVLTVRFELDDELIPTDDDALNASAYVDNHLDSYIINEQVNNIEKADE